MAVKKFLVVGGGSMGQRRIRCLLANGIDPANIRLAETRKDRCEEVFQKHKVSPVSDSDAGLAWGADGVLVSIPGAYHMSVCLAAARARRHFFCEVPLSLDLVETEELTKLVETHHLIAAPGCQPPFHPLVKQAKQWLADPAFGKPLVLRHEFGQYVPDWHPYEDYRKFYASNQKMGGAGLDVVAQDLAMFYWLLEDRTCELACRGSRLSTLEIDGNDCWQVTGAMSRGTAIDLHFDLFQRAPRNRFSLASESGTIELDFGTSTVRRYLAATKQWETVTVPQGYSYEQCYIEEIRLFLGCINGNGRWHNPLPVAIDVVRFLQAMQTSSGAGQRIMI